MALVTVTTPKTLISYTARMSSREVWLGGRPWRATLAVPALLTRMSRRPYSASIHSAASWTDRGSVTSSWTKRASAPPSRRARSAWRPRSSSRAPTSTVMAWDPSWRAVSSPIPLLAPVMRAIFVVMPVTLRQAPGGGRDRRSLGLGVPASGQGTWHARGHEQRRCGRRSRCGPPPRRGPGGHPEPCRAGGVPAGQARPGRPAGSRSAAGGAAADAGAAPAGGRPAGRDLGRLLHPAGAGPRAAPVAAGAVRGGPGADADRR